MLFRRFTIAAFIVVACAAPGFADEPRTPELRKPSARVSMQAFGDANPKCAEWSNACIICKRNEAGAAQCSTPGIACQPKAIACARAGK